MLNVDLNAPYQTYSDKLADQPAAGVAFGTGTRPWGYAAAIGLGLGGDVRAESLDVMLQSADDPVQLLVVDKAYNLVGERMSVPPKAGMRRLRVALPQGAAVLVVQAAEAPQGRPVILDEVVLNTAE